MQATEKMIEAGCEVLYERVAEAHEPEYRDLVARLWQAMHEAQYGRGKISPAADF